MITYRIIREHRPTGAHHPVMMAFPDECAMYRTLHNWNAAGITWRYWWAP